MVRLALLLTGSDDVSERLVQEAFLRLPTDPVGASPGGYLRATVVNLTCDHHRRRSLIDQPGCPMPPTLIPEIDETYAALQCHHHRAGSLSRHPCVGTLTTMSEGSPEPTLPRRTEQCPARTLPTATQTSAYAESRRRPDP